MVSDDELGLMIVLSLRPCQEADDDMMRFPV